MPSPSAPWKVYRQALAPLKYGDALWEPGPIYSYRRVRPGDVGYTRRGRFHLLFSAGIPLGSRVPGTDVPSTFEPLDVGPIILGEARSAGYLRTNTVREIGVDVGGSVAVACAVEPGARMAFELTRKQGAALITKYPTYREDIERERTFENYIKQHYDSWVDFAREHGHGENVRPVLVTGVDLTKEFATVVYSDNQTPMECEFSVGVPAVASGSVSVWGSWRTQGLVHTNCGPYPFPTRPTRRGGSSSESSAFESMIPDGYDQCVFIRYYTIRKRIFTPTLDDRDDFDVVSESVFQQWPGVGSVLLHHHDTQDLPRGDGGELIRPLGKSGVAQQTEMNENGVGQLVDAVVTEPARLVWPYSETIDTARSPILPMKSVPSIVGAPASAMSTKSQHQNALKGREEIDALADRIRPTLGGPVVGSEIDEKPYHSHYDTLRILPTNYLHTFGTGAAQEYPRSATPLTPFQEYLQGHGGAVSGVDEGVVSPWIFCYQHSTYHGTGRKQFRPPAGKGSPALAQSRHTSLSLRRRKHRGCTPLYRIPPEDLDFPLLPQGDSRVIVPQLPYVCEYTQKTWTQKPLVYFSTRGRPGVKLLDALDGKFEGIDNRDDFPFDANCCGIMIRMHFPGYPSSTHVEKRLKQLVEGDGRRSKARSMQMSTKNYKNPPEPVTKSKVVQEVSKRIQWHIADLEANSDLFPFGDRVGIQWRLGQGRMMFEHMTIIGLKNVSAGSWSPIICVD